MVVYRAISVVTLLIVALVSTANAEETAREARIEATIPRYGGFMGVGFDSVWMMSGDKLARISVVDNSITDIPIDGVIGSIGGILSGRGSFQGDAAILAAITAVSLAVGLSRMRWRES